MGTQKPFLSFLKIRLSVEKLCTAGILGNTYILFIYL